MRDFPWLDVSVLAELDNIVRDVFAGSDFVDIHRAEAIAKAVAERVEHLKEHIRSREYGRDNLAHDVKRNIAYSGTEQRGKVDLER